MSNFHDAFILEDVHTSLNLNCELFFFSMFFFTNPSACLEGRCLRKFNYLGNHFPILGLFALKINKFYLHNEDT